MKNKIVSLSKVRPIRYIIAGGFAYVVEMLSLWLAFNIFSLNISLSVTIGYWSGLVTAFFLQKLFTFSNKSKNKKVITKQIVLYIILIIFNYLFTLVFVHFASRFVSLYIARTISIAIIICWNYIIYRNYIFTSNLKIMNAGHKKQNKKSSSKKINIDSIKTNIGIKVLTLVTIYSIFCLLLYIGATQGKILMFNSDQLIDIYLFKDLSTFQQAVFPATHSFLVKWPIFAVIALAENIKSGLLVSSAILYSSIFVFVVIIFQKIIKNWPKTLLLTLAFSSTYLLIPLEPHIGALLPVSYTMLTTRNIEYILFILSIILLARSSKGFKSKYYYVAFLLSTLVIASDKLFLPYYIGGAVLYIVYALLFRRNSNIKSALLWLINSSLAILATQLVIWLININKITTIGGIAGQSPYAIVHGTKQLAKATFFAVYDITTNFGANPTHVPLRRYIDNPSLLVTHTTVFYIFNLAIMLFGFFVLIKLVLNRKHISYSEFWRDIVIRLCMICVVALTVFIVTDHYYPVDSRYLAIIYFTVFIATAVYVKHIKITKKSFNILYVLLLIAVVGSAYTSFHNIKPSQAFYSNFEAQNRLVVKELDNRNIKTLLGDYWQVIPIRQMSNNKLNTLPITNCTESQKILSSQQWYQQVPNNSPIAILINNRPGDNTVLGCTKADILSFYGQPTSQINITSSTDQQLLIYNNGVVKLTSNGPENYKTEIKSLLRDSFGETVCSAGKSLQIVAHQDDDLLFMNPDINKDIANKKCVLTVYLTAGNAYPSDDYWRGREQGSRSAYQLMLKSEQKSWDNSPVTYDKFKLASSTNGRVRLIFIRLPDGGRQGKGHDFNNFQSLSRLWNNQIKTVSSVDGSNIFSESDIESILYEVANSFKPDTIRLQQFSSIPMSRAIDHSDHQAGSLFASRAIEKYDSEYVLKYYHGYDERLLPANLTKFETEQKTNVFLEYSKHDGAVCHTNQDCEKDYDFYGNFLQRQYSETQYMKAKL